MKAVFYNGSNAEFYDNYPIPKILKNESLVEITLAAVCNTDKEILKGYKKDFKGIMGHEFTGIVRESFDKTLIGKRVVGELNLNCGECVYCKTQRPSHCINRKVPGLANKDGCFAEYMVYRNDLLWEIPANLPDEHAVFCEPLAAALELLEQNHLPPSKTVAVIGDGRLSLMCAQVIASNGTPVCVFGRHEEKLNLFKPFAKTFIAIDGFEQSFETVIEASGNPAGLTDAFKIVRSRGKIVLKSTYAENASINISEAVVREINIAGSRCGPFEPAINMLARGLINLPPIDFFELHDFISAFNFKGFKSAFKIKP